MFFKKIEILTIFLQNVSNSGVGGGDSDTTITNPTVAYILQQSYAILISLKNILYFVLAISRSNFAQIQ